MNLQGIWSYLRWTLLLAASCGAYTSFARDAFVMLSGGDSPFENNYSQYLQARAVLNFYERNYPSNSVWVFFGAGNVEGQKPVFADVRHEIERYGGLIDTWVPGSLHRNRPAKREVILRAFKEEILPAVADGGTLFLFVGDHGSRRRGGDRSESIISLWSMERAPGSEHGWKSKTDEVLGVSELRTVIGQGIGKGRVVFCMTQCHSGGFHYLSVPREVSPDTNWFTGTLPDWARPKEEPVLKRAAGFAATDERSMASGCDPSPDPLSWAGYERFLPEFWLGVDLFTLKQKGKRMRSFAEAHAPATLVDQTIDKPCSTSEQYLERWASLIETHLSKETNLTAQVQKQLAAYERTADGALSNNPNRLFRDKQKQFMGFVQKLGQQNTEARELVLNGTRKQLEEAAGSRGHARRGARPTEAENPPPKRRAREAKAAEIHKLWTDTVLPAWRATVDANMIPGLSGHALEFEKHLLNREILGKDFFSDDEEQLDEEIFWFSGYADPQSVKPSRAETIAVWGAERNDTILLWARGSNDGSLRSAAQKILNSDLERWPNGDKFDPRIPAPAAPPARLTKKIAAERALFYRRVLAAWEFLLAMDDRPALARLNELMELERTPFPTPGKSRKAKGLSK